MDTTREGLAPEFGKMLLRLTLGVIFLSHGLPKLLGGVAGTGDFLAGMGVPLAGAVAWGLTLLEVGGGVLLILGLLVPPVAALLSLHMLAGIVLVHGANGWYVVGPGQGGAEFNVLLVAGLVALILAGSGPALLPGRSSGA
jgi:putative oxidoreductase